VIRLRTSGAGARRIGLARRSASQASISAKSHTTHLGVSRNRLGNWPRCSISQMVLSASGTMRRNWVFLIVRLNGGSAWGIECLHVPVEIELERLREA